MAAAPEDDKTVIADGSGSPHGALPGDAAQALPAGTRLGEFEIVGLVGVGGFGIVYLALDHSLGRRVALKEYMPQALAARTAGATVGLRSARHAETFEAGRRSFVNEARLLAQFDHPSLLKVYRFWEANGTAYMVMPYYEGPTLKQALAQLPSAPDQPWLERLLVPLLDALRTMHAAQVYHRDIAPDNILLLADGRPLLLDFGAARHVITDMQQALTVILKPGYAPIEQYAEAPGLKQGPWTDLYALAAVIAFAINGQTPPPSVSRMVHDSLQPLAERAAGRYTPRFLAALDAALALRPAERPRSVREFELRLGLAQQAEAAQAAQAAPAAPRPRSAGAAAATAAGADSMAASTTQGTARRRPLLLGGVAAAGVAAAGVVALAAALLPSWRGGEPSGEANRAAPTPADTVAAASAAAASMPPVAAAAAVAPAAMPTAGPTATAATAATAAKTATAAATTLAARDDAQTAPLPEAAVTSPPAAAPAARGFDPHQEIERIHAQRDPAHEVSVELQRSQVVIGRDQLQFGVRSSRDGYLYLLMVGTDQGHFHLLFPNRLDQANRMVAGRTLQLPRKGWSMVAGGPPGLNRFVAIVSAAPRDFGPAGLVRVDPFAEFPLQSAARIAAKAAALGTDAPSPFAGTARCRPADAACPQGYGAALFTIEERLR